MQIGVIITFMLKQRGIPMNIVILRENSVLKYAAEELKSYLGRILVPNQDIVILIKDKYEYIANTIWLGLDSEFGEVEHFKLKDKSLDDAVFINIICGEGIIAGSNDRSILLGVYRFLHEIGCRFIRPGSDGEILPCKNINELKVHVRHEASFRHRGIVIEGANSYENVADLIEWMPKLGYNSYFMQFKEPYSFFRNWYCHVNNTMKTPETFTLEDSKKIVKGLEEEIKKRGMLYHTVGHGWTSECLDVPTIGWDVINDSVSEEKKQYLAQINGKRDFFRGIPLNTNLCYSNKDAMELMADAVVNYSKNNPNADYIHVWLADETNNHCECEACQKMIPTDFYIQLLNLIDEKLTKEGLSCRIVFLVYLELLWAPEKEKFINLDRFILMFAPISRTFTKSYGEIEFGEVNLPEYNRNKVVLPNKLSENVGFLRKWQELCDTDSFDFDYPLGRAHYGDAGYYEISKVISEDIKNLDTQLRLNGYLSCQEQRAFMPTGLPNYIMGLTLWDKATDFDAIAEDYFVHAFGEGWADALQYLKTLSDIFDTDYWHGIKKWEDPKVEADMATVEAYVNSFRPTITANLNQSSESQSKSWEYLNWHADFTILFAKFLLNRAKRDNEATRTAWGDLKSYVQRTEDDVQRVFDVYRFVQISEWIHKIE